MRVYIYFIVKLSNLAHHFTQLLVDGTTSKLFEIQVDMVEKLSFILMLVVTHLQIIYLH